MNNKSLTGIIVVALMIGSGMYWRSHHISLPSETEMPQILREAAGTAPIPQNDTPGRKALRDSFKQFLDENKSYQAEVDKHFTTGHLNGLLGANSLLSGDSQQIVSELQELKDLDQKHLTALQNFPEIFKTNLSAAGASKAEVEAFERGMRKGMSGGLEGVEKSLELEMKWLDASVELYQYAGENQSHMHARGAQLEFDDESVRQHFVELSQKVDDLGTQKDQAQAAFNNVQQQNRQKMGITAQDVGQANGQ